MIKENFFTKKCRLRMFFHDKIDNYLSNFVKCRLRMFSCDKIDNNLNNFVIVIGSF